MTNTRERDVITGSRCVQLYTDHTYAECQETWWHRADSGCWTLPNWRRYYIAVDRHTGVRQGRAHSSVDNLGQTDTRRHASLSTRLKVQTSVCAPTQISYQKLTVSLWIDTHYLHKLLLSSVNGQYCYSTKLHIIYTAAIIIFLYY